MRTWFHDNDDGALMSIELAMYSLLILVMIVSPLDYHIAESNKSTLQHIAKMGSSDVATYGGNGDATRATALENERGVSRSDQCAAFKTNLDASGRIGQTSNYLSSSIPFSSLSAIECGMLTSIVNSQLVNVVIDNVSCAHKEADGSLSAVQYTKKNRQRVSCSITYTYNGLPLSAFSIFKIRALNETGLFEGKSAFLKQQTVVGESHSDVGYGEKPNVLKSRTNP